MKRYTMTIMLKDDPALIEKYLEAHRAVWPEVENGLKAIGILSMEIYSAGRMLLTMMNTIDEFEPEADFARYMAADSRCRQWQQNMADCLEGLDDVEKGGARWIEIESVYHLS